jgi:hypothetical protein
MNTSYAAWSFLIIVGLLACMQMSYDAYMSIEHILVIYRELKFKSYSMRLDRLEKLQLFGKETIESLETG